MEPDVDAVLSHGDGSRGWVGGVCGERGVPTPLGKSRSRVNDDPENLVKPMSPAILMLRESQLFFLV